MQLFLATRYAQDAHLLGEFIKDMDNIEKVELLPYHKLGAHKWEALSMTTRLKAQTRQAKRKWTRLLLSLVSTI